MEDRVIRVATDADIPEMHRIRLSVRENRLADPARIQPDDYRPMLGERGRGWVAEIAGRMGGFAVADRSRASIWALFVEPSREGQGVGRALHDTMLDWLFGHGVVDAWLGTEPATRAERFYRASGWRFVEMRRGEAIFTMSAQEWLARGAAPPCARPRQAMARQNEVTHPNRAAFPAGMSGPALRALRSAGIGSMDDLPGWTEADLAALHGMGPKGIHVLRDALAASGRRFRRP